MEKAKTHTTNYYDTFIEVAEDTKAVRGTKPPSKTIKTIAERQFELLANNPYRFSSDDILFRVFADRNDLIKDEYKNARLDFFSKGQPCFRSSPLTKRYGFGIHADSNGKIAMYGMETEQYQQLQINPEVKKVKAMRSSKK